MKKKYFWGASGVGLVTLAVAFVSCQDGTPQPQTVVGADGVAQSIEPGTTIVNHNYPEGTAPPNQTMALSAEQAMAEYSTRLILLKESARGSFEQGLICTAAGISFQAHQEANAAGQPVERFLAARLEQANKRMSEGWSLVERVSFNPGDRDKFYGPLIDILALNMAMEWAASGAGIPAGCEVIPETVTGPTQTVVDATGSMLRTKNQVPTLVPLDQTAQQPTQTEEVPIDAGQTE